MIESDVSGKRPMMARKSRLITSRASVRNATQPISKATPVRTAFTKIIRSCKVGSRPESRLDRLPDGRLRAPGLHPEQLASAPGFLHSLIGGSDGFFNRFAVN